MIFFQEITKEDGHIARDYGWEPIGTFTNVGIATAFKTLVQCATGDLFLFLENDWEATEPEPLPIIYEAAELLRNRVIDVARLRSTFNPGEPVWSSQFKGREMDRPEYLLESVYWRPHEQLQPIIGDTVWYATNAHYAAWTNNPFMARTEWLEGVILPRATGDIEKDIHDWWLTQKYVVAASERGIFTHNRLDR